MNSRDFGTAKNSLPEKAQLLRGQAEQLVDPSAMNRTEVADGDLNRVLHELQVHQIELEIQNEELRRTQMQLEESRDCFSSLFDYSPIGYMTLDSKLLISRINIAAAQLIGQSNDSLIGKTFSQFISTETADLFYLHCQKARESKVRQSCNLALTLGNKQRILVELNTIFLNTEEANSGYFQIALSDNTEKEQSRIALEQAREDLELRVRERTRELESANIALLKSDLELRKLSSAVKQSRSSIMITDQEGKIEYINPRLTELTGFTIEEVSGKKPNIFSSGTTAIETYQEMWRTITDGREWRGLLQNRRKSRECYWEELCISPIADEKGHITHFLGVGEDVTARKASEERQQLLMAELDHRVKNTLSVVIAIAKQTLRTNTDLESFRLAFEGRLMALAQVHRLLTKNRWGAVLLEELINLAIKPHIGSSGPTATVEGPDVKLNPKDAQSIHLIFHELATNAAKYGSFSLSSGHVSVEWRIEQQAESQTVHIKWVESGAPTRPVSSTAGFGHVLIQRTVVDGLAGSSTIDCAPTGFTWSASFPLPEPAVTIPTFLQLKEHRSDVR